MSRKKIKISWLAIAATCCITMNPQNIFGVILGWDFENLSGPQALQVPDGNTGSHNFDIVSPDLTTGWKTLSGGIVGYGFNSVFLDGEEKNFAFLQTPAHADFNLLTKLSISAWVWVPNNTGSLPDQIPSTPLRDSLTILCYGETKRPFNLFIDTTGVLVFEWNKGDGVGGSGSGSYKSKSTITYGRWHHIALTFNAGNVISYIDGQKDPNENPGSSKRLGTTNEALRIGAMKTGTVGYEETKRLTKGLYGKLDEIIVSTHSIFTQAEISKQCKVLGGPHSLDKKPVGLC